MPTKTKKKTGKKSAKSAKKAAVKKTAKKKATKKAAARPAKKKSAMPRRSGTRPKAPRISGSDTCPNTWTPQICVGNFSAGNNDCVYFQSIPAVGVRITQIGNTFPFSPVTGTFNGMSYTEVAVAGVVYISAGPGNYPYAVNCSCPGPVLEGNHSVTVTG
jgi:hypothetical protein